jgi:hypothetical protein
MKIKLKETGHIIFYYKTCWKIRSTILNLNNFIIYYQKFDNQVFMNKTIILLFGFFFSWRMTAQLPNGEQMRVETNSLGRTAIYGIRSMIIYKANPRI